MLPEENVTEEKERVEKVEKVTIQDAIKNAEASLKAKDETKETSKTKSEETSKEPDASKNAKDEEDEDEEDSEDDPDALTEEDEKQAINLYKALKNPKSGPIILEAMAREAGLTKDSTKEEKKTAVNTIEEVLKKHLGENFPTLAEVLGPAIKEAIEVESENRVKPIRERQEQQEAKEFELKVNLARDTALARFDNATDEKLLKEVVALMDQIKPTANTTMVKYFNSLIITAADNLNYTLKRKEVKETKETTSLSMEERRERNRQDAKSRLESEGKTTVGKTVGESSKDARHTVKDAVELAVQQLAGKGK